MMRRSYPSDVFVLDTDGILHARLDAGRKTAKIHLGRTYRLAENTFENAVVTPALTNEAALADVLRRARTESGRIERASILLPDSWFRMNLVELPPLSERQNEALHTVRWSLKRTLPIPPETLRVTWVVLGKTAKGVNLLVLSAVEATLAAIERIFEAAGIDVVVIEPVGLNIWNAVAVREPPSTGDRLFLYIREHDFTTAVFRAGQPLFIRSRNLSGERTLQQEIRLSASYMRDTLQTGAIERCYVAGSSVDGNLHRDLESEFGAPVTAVNLRDFVEHVPAEVTGVEAELTACTGVFTG
jgi:Tfp pilus assembly PilM family ATPase